MMKKAIFVYVSVVLCGILTSLFAVSLFWYGYGEKVAKVILSVAPNGSLGKNYLELNYHLIALDNLEKQEYDLLFQLHCMQLDHLLDTVDPTVSDNNGLANDLSTLKNQSIERLGYLKQNGFCPRD